MKKNNVGHSFEKSMTIDDFVELSGVKKYKITQYSAMLKRMLGRKTKGRCYV